MISERNCFGADNIGLVHRRLSNPMIILYLGQLHNTGPLWPISFTCVGMLCRIKHITKDTILIQCMQISGPVESLVERSMY